MCEMNKNNILFYILKRILSALISNLWYLLTSDSFVKKIISQ